MDFEESDFEKLKSINEFNEVFFNKFFENNEVYLKKQFEIYREGWINKLGNYIFSFKKSGWQISNKYFVGWPNVDYPICIPFQSFSTITFHKYNKLFSIQYSFLYNGTHYGIVSSDEFVLLEEMMESYLVNLELMESILEKKELVEIKEKEDQLQLQVSTFLTANTIPEIRSFNEILLQNQKQIDKEYILPFVKLNEYLKAKQNSMEKQRIMLREINIDNNVSMILDNFEKQNQYLKSLHEISIKMINALIGNELILFYTIYNEFEKLGIFNSKFEKDLLNAMGDLSNNIIGVMDSISSLESSVWTGVNDLVWEINKIKN